MPSLSQSRSQRAAVYVRVSTAGQEDEGTSLGTQEEACRRYAAERGYAVAEDHFYREVHTGTELWERPRLTALREAVRRREVELVIAYAIDRLSRDPVHLGVVISEAEHAGADVQFVTEPMDGSPEGQLIRYVRGYAAKVEHEKFKERSHRAKRAVVQSGRLLKGCKPPYGYRWADEQGRSIEDPATAPIVRRMFDGILKGLTLRGLAMQFNREAIPAPKGRGLWCAATLSVLLRRRVYAGDAEAFRTKSTRRDGKWHQTFRPAAERFALPEGTIPALVAAETFEAVQERLSINKKHAYRNNPDPEQSLLRAGFVRCGDCGCAMAVANGNPWRYQCATAARGTGACKTHGIKGETLDQAVWSRIERVLMDPSIIRAEVERLRKDDPTAADLVAIDGRIAELARKQDNLARRVAGEDDDDVADVLKANLGQIIREKRQAEQERQSIATRRADWKSAQDRLGDLERWCSRVAARLGTMTYAQKRTALLAFGVEARVFRVWDKPRYQITASIPLEDPDCVANVATFEKLQELVVAE